jgi:hypothetical protein
MMARTADLKAARDHRAETWIGQVMVEQDHNDREDCP